MSRIVLYSQSAGNVTVSSSVTRGRGRDRIVIVLVSRRQVGVHGDHHHGGAGAGEVSPLQVLDCRQRSRNIPRLSHRSPRPGRRILHPRRSHLRAPGEGQRAEGQEGDEGPQSDAGRQDLEPYPDVCGLGSGQLDQDGGVRDEEVRERNHQGNEGEGLGWERRREEDEVDFSRFFVLLHRPDIHHWVWRPNP